MQSSRSSARAVVRLAGAGARVRSVPRTATAQVPTRTLFGLRRHPKYFGLMNPHRHSLDSFFDENNFPEAKFEPAFDFPLHVDVVENTEKNEIKLLFDIPGLEKNDVNVELVNGHLMVSGERTQEKTSQSKNFHARERTFGSFARSMFVGKDVKPEDIKAEANRGVLCIRFPKSRQAIEEQETANKIEVAHITDAEHDW